MIKLINGRFIAKIHIYNQAVVAGLKTINNCLLLDRVDPKEVNPALLGPLRNPVRKLPFRLDEIPYFDTSYMCEALTDDYLADPDSDAEGWGGFLKTKNNLSSKIVRSTYNDDNDDDFDEDWSPRSVLDRPIMNA